MKRLVILFVFGLLSANSYSSITFPTLHCSTMLYVGNVSIKLDLDDMKYVILRERVEHLPDVILEVVSEGEITNISNIGTGLSEIIEFEDLNNTSGELHVFNKPMRGGLPGRFKSAKLILDGEETKFGLMCF